MYSGNGKAVRDTIDVGRAAIFRVIKTEVPPYGRSTAKRPTRPPRDCASQGAPGDPFLPFAGPVLHCGVRWLLQASEPRLGENTGLHDQRTACPTLYRICPSR